MCMSKDCGKLVSIWIFILSWSIMFTPSTKSSLIKEVVINLRIEQFEIAN